MPLPLRPLTLALMLTMSCASTADAALELRNQHLFRYLLVDVYTAELYSAPDTPLAQALAREQPLRLTLRYHRNIDRDDLTKAALTTLERQHGSEQVEQWQDELTALHEAFRDVSAGDTYSLDRRPDGSLELYYNDSLAYRSETPGLATLYLGIWLDEDGLSEGLRSALLK